MSKFSVRLFALALLLPASAPAQSQDATPAPRPPFVAAIPDHSTWVIKVSRQGPAANAPAGGRIVEQLAGEKSGADREMTTLWSDGSQSSLWFYKGYRIEQEPGSPLITVTDLRNAQDPEATDFIDLQWLSLSNYVGIESQANQTCYHFQAKIKPKYQRITLVYSADIDVKTRLPVMWDVGPIHFEMVSLDPGKATSPLVLPPALASQLRASRLASTTANSYKKQ